MIYFDTAYLLKCYVNENGSEDVRSFASQHDRIACCEFGRLELSAAFHRVLREGFIDEGYFKTIFEQFQQDEQDGVWTWLPLSLDLMESVVSGFKSLPATVYLRTGDLIHLQCAAVNNVFDLYTNDTHMLKAADHFGVNASNVIAAGCPEQEPPNQ